MYPYKNLSISDKLTLSVVPSENQRKPEKVTKSSLPVNEIDIRYPFFKPTNVCLIMR